MGLDTFAIYPQTQKDEDDNIHTSYKLSKSIVKDFANIDLCGGMWSETGKGSFGGRKYNEEIEQITDTSLYEQYISPDIVNDMCEGFKKYINDNEGVDEHIIELCKFFKVCVKHGLALYNWW